MGGSRRGSWVVAFAAVAAARAWAAAPQPVVVLEDPRGDDRGPGTYVYPTGPEYRPGDFDLRRFSVRVDGEDAVLEVTLGAEVRRHIVPQRGDRGDLRLDNGLYTQNVDIYVDSAPGGATQGLPGRRIAFAPESGWERVVSLVPQPGLTRSELRDWDDTLARNVVTPGPVRASGSTLSVRVPLAQLGGRPQKSWGWAVTVSGAAWDPSFAVVDRIRGTSAPRGFTLPVYGVPEERAFGGGKLNGNHPNVIDVLVPEGVTQAQVLRGFTRDQVALVPVVYPDPARAAEVAAARAARERGEPPATVAATPTPAAPAASGAPAAPQAPVAAAPGPAAGPPVPAAPGASQAPVVASPGPAAGSPAPLQLSSVEGETAVLPVPPGVTVRAWQLGTVLDAEGRQVGRLVVTLVKDGFAVANVIEGKGRVAAGHRVRLAPTEPRPAAPSP